MKKRKIVVLAFLQVMFFTAGYGQQHLSLKDALQYTLENSEVLRQARLDIINSEHKVSELRAAALPQLNATSSLTGNPIQQQFVLPAEAFGGPPGEFMAITAGQPWNAMTQVQLSQQVFNKQVFEGLKAAKGSLRYAELAATLSEENVIQQVATNYYMVIINREKLQVVEANRKRIRQLEEIVAGQLAAGLAKKIDLDRIRVNKSNIDAQYQQLENAVLQQEYLLKYYMGMPVTAEIRLRDTAAGQAGPAASIAEDADISRLPEVQLLQQEEELLGLQRRANLAEYYPKLSLGANYTYNTQSGRFNLYSNRALNFDMSAVTLTLNIPIFDGGTRRAKVRQTDVSLAKLQEETRKTTNSLTMAHENAKMKIRNNLKTIATQRANKQLAQEVFESAQNNYHNGLATLTDLLDAEAGLVEAENSYNEALLNYKVAEIDLLKSQGAIKSLLEEK